MMPGPSCRKPRSLQVLEEATTTSGAIYGSRGLLTTNRRRALGLIGSSALLAVGPVSAQSNWRPDHPVKFILPLPPGGGPDSLTRLIAEFLRRKWNQTVTVENRPGASGVIGLKQVSVQSPADGHTLAYVVASHVTADLLSPQFDLLKEFDLVTMYLDSPFLLLSHSASPYKSLKDVIDAARTSPGKLIFGSGGVGSANHMVMAELLDKAGVTMLHVPYKGGLASTQALASGEIDLAANIPSSVRAVLNTGRIRVLASATRQRLPHFPEVPTVREALGVDFVASGWGGFGVRKGTPAPIVSALHAALVESMRDPAIVEFIQTNSSLLAPSETPKAFEDVVRRQYATEAELIKRLKIKAE